MANSLSKKISIFPISFDRSQEEGYTYYERNTTPPSETLTDEQKSFLKNNLILSSYPGADYETYYTERSTNNTDSKRTYANGRILSEKNITRLISALTDDDHKNFVVHADIPNSTTCNYIEFVIRGRYFSLDLTNNSDTSGTPLIPNNSALWVGVKFKDQYIINDPGNIDEYEQLFAYDKANDANTSDNPGDDYDVLAEVDFFNTAPNQPDGWKSTDYNEHLQLLEIVDGNLRVPTASQFKFTSRSIQNINGGTV